MLKEGATIPFKTIKISCINIVYTMSCDLRKRSSHCHRRTCHGRTKSTWLYIFLFSFCFSTQQYCMVIFNMCRAIFSPSWSVLGAHLLWKPFCRIWHLFHVWILEVDVCQWFLKASNLDFITLNTNNLTKKTFFLIFYQYQISFFDAVWVDL